MSALHRVTDEPAIASLMKRLYAVISFEEGEEPDWRGLGEVFSEHARITRITPEGIDFMDLPRIENLVEVSEEASSTQPPSSLLGSLRRISA